MNKLIIYLIMLLTLSMVGNAVQKNTYGFYTDRDVYVSGEILFAKIFLPQGQPSGIICLDLVNENGTRIMGASLAIHDNEAEGYLQLPDSLHSGTYLVRTYQKYNAAQVKAMREIWISNRFDKPDQIRQVKRVEVSSIIQDKSTAQIEINHLDSIYKPNSLIEVNVTLDTSLIKELDGNLLVNIAQTDPSFIARSFSVIGEQSKPGIMENKGIIISGTIADKKTGESARDITVYLTIPDSIPGFQYYQTKNDGRFYFLLDNYYGSVQVVIQCFGSVPTQRLTIRLDDFYAESGVLPKFRTQPIDEEFRKNINRNISSVTFRKVFGQEFLQLLEGPKKSMQAYPFYGRATQTIDPQRFIDLPDFNEISRELLPGVKFRNYNNEPSLQVVNSSTHYFFEEKPMILLDGIPIRDLNVIKDMGTKDIDRIEICQTERFYGDLRFPGVLALYTTKADYSGLPESSQLLRLKIEAIQRSTTQAEAPESASTIPDLRQLLYWNPSTVPDQHIFINCRTSTLEGLFKIQIRGRLKDGTLIYSEKNFEVR